MKTYSKEKSLRTMLLANTLALTFPLAGAFSGLLHPGSAWMYISLGLLILPLFNAMRLLMRITLNVRSRTLPLASAWFLVIACVVSALWWIPRYTDITLK